MEEISSIVFTFHVLLNYPDKLLSFKKQEFLNFAQEKNE